jgi:hypothetical protein
MDETSKIALQSGVHLGAVDHRAAGRDVLHLLQGQRRPEHIAGQLLATPLVAAPHVYPVVHRETAMAPGAHAFDQGIVDTAFSSNGR